MRYFAVFVTVIMFLLPLAASADQISDLQAQVQVLTQVLNQLRQQKGAGAAQPPTPTASCAPISRPLGPGSSGTDVTALQQFIARDSSIYPEGKVTGYYGALTTAAVKRFQVKYHIVTSGTPATTGYGRVGPKTLAVINAQCGGASATNTGPVGAFMQVSPDQGSAPLYVSIQVTANTTNSCSAAVYTLDYGDQSPPQQIPLPAGTCQPVQQTYTHTYQQAATYNIVLSSGDHSSEATVVAQ